MRCRFIIALLFLFALCSCHTSTLDKLSMAELLLREQPDSSLMILKAIRPEELKTQKIRADYALLVSLALDKNYIDIQSDSIIKPSVEYYSKRGCTRNRMLTWYSLGIVQKNAGEYIPSMISFEKAENDACALEDYFYLGLIYQNKASLFNKTNNNPAVVDCLKRAVVYFEKADMALYKTYAEYSLALGFSHKADSVFNIILDNTDRPSLIEQCNIRRAGILVQQDSLPNVSILLYQNNPHRHFGLLDYGYLAQAFERIGQKDSSDYWFSQGYSRCQKEEQSATLDYIRSKVEYSRGNYDIAYSLVDHATTVQDSVTRVLLQQSLSAAQRDYYKNEAQLREERIHRLRERTGWGTALGVLTLLLTITIALLRARKRDRQLQEQMALLALEERNLERVKSENAHLVGSLFNEKIGRLEELNDLYFKEEDEKQKERIFKQIRQTAASLRKDPTLFPSLEKDLDRYCNGIMTKLQEQVPSIKGENNLHTIMLFFAGFSYPVVQFILNKVSIESLKTARSRFRKEILSADAADADMFLEMLEMKKRPQADTNESLNC